MRYTTLIVTMAALISVSSTTNAAPIIVTVTQTVPATQSFAAPNGYELDFFFQPFTTVPPNITTITASFSGSIFPGTRTAANGPVTFVTLQPYASFNNDLPSQANPIVPTVRTRSNGTPVIIPFDMTTGTAQSGLFQSISTTGTFAVSPGILQALTSQPFSMQVILFSVITANTPNTTSFFSDQVDYSTGNGAVTLTLTNATVPEPASATILAIAALATIVRKRRPLHA